MYEWEKMVLTALRVFQHSQSLGKILSQSVMYLSWFNPAGNSASHNRLLNSPPPHCGMGERIGRVKVENLVGWGENNLVMETE